ERQQAVGHDVTEVFVDQEQQFGRTGLRFDVDGDTIVDASRLDAHLEVRRLRIVFAAIVDDTADEYAILLERHESPAGACGAPGDLRRRQRVAAWRDRSVMRITRMPADCAAVR